MDDTPSSPSEVVTPSAEPERSSLVEPTEPGSPASSVNALAQLAELHDRGALTDEEFASAKARLLDL